jgi:polysaccharide export outer membrane protein
MLGRGPRKLLLALGAILALCAASTGCHMTLGTEPTANNDEAAGDKRPDRPLLPKPSSGELPPALIKQAAHTPDVLPNPQGPPTPQSPGGAHGPAGLPGPIGPLGPHCGPGLPGGAHLGFHGDGMGPDMGPLPRELMMTSHPPYTIAPPDILYIDAIRMIPRPPYRVEPLEVLRIQVSETLPNQPISGEFVVSPEGTINLGFNYGTVRVAGMTVDQIQATIRSHLGMILRNPQVSVALIQFRGLQQTRGEHLVRQDGTVGLGNYGCVYVAGMTLDQAKCAIEKHLSQFLLNPQVSVDVFAYNSKVYYVIADGGGFGQQVIRFPITGNETILDAIANIQGLPPVSSKKRIWLARPSPATHHCNQILPVNWEAILAGSTETNYQLFPGDRVYVSADRLIAFDNWLSKVLAPVERMLGITLLGASTYQTIRNGGTGSGVGFIAVP